MAERVLSLQQRLEASEALMLAMRDDSCESRSKLELLVAENAALKESRKRLGEFILEEIDADYPLNMDVKTPVTDAMVNEIRAEGVELAINHLMNKFEGTGHIGVPVMALESLANQLRADSAKDGSDD
nr:hypothetical protein [Pantoea sp. Seng]